MSDLIYRLRGIGGVGDEAADLIEQLQKRVVELEQELAEEKDCHKTTYSLMKSGEQRGVQKATEELQPKVDELTAHLERLRTIAFPYIDLLPELVDWFNDTPHQSLAERDYKIAYNAFHAGVVYADTVPKGTGDTPGAAEAYADSVKRGKA